MPISISARLAFEQTYGGIEGDSASSTELFCLLSAISGIPLRQDIAVTGSIDQFGRIQPIGGVNEKIEGFFAYCRVRGLTGTQGVIIPAANVKHLMLHDDVLDAVQRGEFMVWAISEIDEGLEILTGVQAGILDESGSYPEDSVHGRVKASLSGWIERSAKFKRKLSGTGLKSEEDDEGEQGEEEDEESIGGNG
jgi:predicted ATP-dependent protease